MFRIMSQTRGYVKFLAKYVQLPCRSDLRIATKHPESRESEFPPTKNYAVNAKNFTHPTITVSLH